MARPKGTPKTGGRQKGAKNLLTSQVKEIALSYAPKALEVLIEIASAKDSPPQARVAASKELLDRGVGKSIQTQIVQAEVTAPRTLADFYGENK